MSVAYNRLQVRVTALKAQADTASASPYSPSHRTAYERETAPDEGIGGLDGPDRHPPGDAGEDTPSDSSESSTRIIICLAEDVHEPASLPQRPATPVSSPACQPPTEDQTSSTNESLRLCPSEVVPLLLELEDDRFKSGHSSSGQSVETGLADDLSQLGLEDSEWELDCDVSPLALDDEETQPRARSSHEDEPISGRLCGSDGIQLRPRMPRMSGPALHETRRSGETEQHVWDQKLWRTIVTQLSLDTTIRDVRFAGLLGVTWLGMSTERLEVLLAGDVLLSSALNIPSGTEAMIADCSDFPALMDRVRRAEELERDALGAEDEGDDEEYGGPAQTLA